MRPNEKKSPEDRMEHDRDVIELAERLFVNGLYARPDDVYPEVFAKKCLNAAEEFTRIRDEFWNKRRAEDRA